ncbi:hypothetical protein Pcinc_001128 [Petrolisthes cinctipes]|uniref:Uncharacterized protein n=1 Tax=Petrolisthes cinctipes TaxID=88211 RepID=A0AAE1L4U9_PETCI|nr:hypothetical protein Pcinc_001128 [Petrolisthes cinctipes]
MTCICEQTWRALCALKEAITSPCTSTGDDQPFAHSSNNSNISTTSSNFPLDERVIEADLGLSNTGFEGDSFTTALEKPRDSWRPVLRFHDPTATNNVTTTVDPHTDSGHWTNQSGFTEIDLGDGPQGDVVDGSIPIPNNIRHTDSRSTTRESGYGRSLHDSNGSSSPEPSVAVAFNAPTNPGLPYTCLTTTPVSPLHLPHYTSYIKLVSTLHLSHYICLTTKPVSPLHLSHYTCLTTTPVSLHLPHHYTCLTTPVSPLHLSHHYTCLTTPVSPLHLSYYTCLTTTPASPLHLSHYTCLTTTPVLLHLSHHYTCLTTPVSPLHLSHYTCLTTTPVSLHLPHHYTCLTTPVSPLHLSHYTCLTTTPVSLHLPHNYTCLTTPASPLHLSYYTCLTTTPVLLHLPHNYTCLTTPASPLHLS